MEDFVYEESFLHPTNILLNVTDACNLKCRYCFVEQHPHYMNFSTAKAAVDWVVSNYYWKLEKNIIKENKHITIYFFGGEPTLQWDVIIYPLCKYCKSQYPNLIFKFGMTTNGTLLNEERIQFCKEYDFHILLSCDGNQSTQNYNRPCHNEQISSFNLIKPNLYLIKKYFPTTTFRSTIIPETVDNLYDDYCFAESLGFTWYYSMPNCRQSWPEDKINVLKEQIQKIFVRRTNQYILGIEPMHFSLINEFYNFILSRDISFTTNDDYFINKKNPSKKINRCGLGINQCAIAYDGNIYGCQEQPSKGKKSFFYIGNLFIDQGINKEEHTRLLTAYVNRQNLVCENKILCQKENCPLWNICYVKDCPSTSYDLFQDLNTQSEIKCIWKSIILNNCITQMKILIDKNCEYFINYLNRLPSFIEITQQLMLIEQQE